MEYGLSTRGFSKERLGSRTLDRILDAGFRQIEIFAVRRHFDYWDTHRVRDIGGWFSDHEVSCHALHGPSFTGLDGPHAGGLAISVAYTERRLRIESMDEIKRVLDVAEYLPYRYLVLHLGVDEEYSLDKFDAAFTSLEHLRLFAKDRGAKLLLENTRSPLGNPERLLQFLNYTRLDDVGICFDVGHARLTGGVRDAFQVLGGRTASVHLHDNRGEQDDHLVPFDGTMDWAAVIQDLRSAGSAGSADSADAASPALPALLEVGETVPEATNLRRLREVVEKLERLQERPVE
jgi:sugar phosphate isomerase/epimerase